MTDLPESVRAALAPRYRLEREIGRGGMAVVYAARDTVRDTPVAIKVLRDELTKILGPQRFLREIEIASRLSHPAIVPVIDSGQAAGSLYYVMPFIEGETLRARLKRETQLPLDDALRITREVAKALTYVHANQVVHRDIKPENILLSGNQVVLADFGIARVLGNVDQETLSTTGLAIGTPTYMSPEQAAASQNIDSRSDIYSLGCVLYEMLAGEPPFTGPTPQAVTARHISEPPRSIRIVRPATPPSLQIAIEKALSKVPADRFQSVDDFAHALTESTPDTPRIGKRGYRLMALGGGVLGIVVMAYLSTTHSTTVRERYIVLPFTQSSPNSRGGEMLEGRLYNSLRRWAGIELVDPLLAKEVVLRRGIPRTLYQARTSARAAGATRLVWGELTQHGDSVLIDAATYDLSDTRSPSRRTSVRASATDAGLADVVDVVVDSLLTGGGLVGRRNQIQSVAAARSLVSGDSALRQWNLEAAFNQYRTAVDSDPGFGLASLRAAQVAEWLGIPAPEWAGYADRAARSVQLTGADSALAIALDRLAQEDFPGACAQFRKSALADSTEFASWLGLGDCDAADQIVVSDRGSPSGWRFRSSYSEAANAYERALRVLPSAFLALRGRIAQRLGSVLLTSRSAFRLGRLAQSDTLRFFAAPTLLADSVGYVPWPERRLGEPTPFARPDLQLAALRKNSAALDRISAVWVSLFAGRPEAWEARAGVLERSGRLIEPASGSALTAFRRARRLAPEARDKLRYAIGEIRVNLKADDFHGAAALADTMLNAYHDPAPELALDLAPLAMLLGRKALAADLLQRSAAVYPFVTQQGKPVSVPPKLAQAALRLLAHASMPEPAVAIDKEFGDVERLIQSFFQRDARSEAREALLLTPWIIAFDGTSRKTPTGMLPTANYLGSLQSRLAIGDTRSVRAELERLELVREQARFPDSEISAEAFFQESLLWLAVGDTSRCLQLLDRRLNVVSMQREDLLQSVFTVASLRRAFELRRRLGMAAGDSAGSERWGQTLRALSVGRG